MQYEALYNYYYYYTHLTASFQDKVRQYQIGKTSLNLTEARDDGVLGCSGISWTICKQSAHRYMHTLTSLQTDNHTNTPTLNFYRLDALPDARPTVSKHYTNVLFIFTYLMTPGEKDVIFP